MFLFFFAFLESGTFMEMGFVMLNPVIYMI